MCAGACGTTVARRCSATHRQSPALTGTRPATTVSPTHTLGSRRAPGPIFGRLTLEHETDLH
jgi:hypothetical protein